MYSRMVSILIGSTWKDKAQEKESNDRQFLDHINASLAIYCQKLPLSFSHFIVV
jgi:hypothetical protein